MSWTTLAEDVADVVTLLEPVLATVTPAGAAAVAVASKIVTGLAAAEPEAVALVATIKSGATPTAAQLATYASDYQAAYAQLDTDIAAAEAKAGTAG